MHLSPHLLSSPAQTAGLEPPPLLVVEPLVPVGPVVESESGPGGRV